MCSAPVSELSHRETELEQGATEALRLLPQRFPKL